MSTDEGDIVLDPFLGTGTTAISAKRLGRNFIGFELDDIYVEVSKQKIKNTKADSKIGDIWVSFYLDEVVTVRNDDWDDLSVFFEIPEDRRIIDYYKIKLKDNQQVKIEL